MLAMSMEISRCRSILFYDFYDMAAAMENLKKEIVSKSVNYFSKYDFLKGRCQR